MTILNPVEISLLPNQIKKEDIGNDYYRITENFKCTIIEANTRKYIYHVNKGFETNFRSGPDWLDCYIPRIGELPVAISWLIHDINYEGYLCSRKKADKLLFQMLEVANFDETMNEAIYIGLRLFGWTKYSKSANNEHVEFYRPSLANLMKMRKVAIERDESFSNDLEVKLKVMMKDIEAQEFTFDKADSGAIFEHEMMKVENMAIERDELFSNRLEIMLNETMEDMDTKELTFNKKNHQEVEQLLMEMAKGHEEVKDIEIAKYYQ